MAREVAEAFAPTAEDEGKTLVTRLDVLLPLAGDKELLAQMIANLIDNALGHTPAGVRIEVGGERTPAGIALSVSDNGPGVAPADMEAIFHRFYRAGEAHRAPEPASVSRWSPRLPTSTASTARLPTMAPG